MDIKYGGFSFKDNNLSIPKISTSTDLNFTDGGALLGGVLNITLQGQILGTGVLNDISNYKLPAVNTAWFGLADLVNKIESGFSRDYQNLDINCGDNHAVIWGIGNYDPLTTKVQNIKFSNNTDNNWLQIIDYTIDLQTEITGITDYISTVGNTECYVSSIENSYSIEPIMENNFYSTNPPINNNSPPATDMQFRGKLYPYISGEIFYPGYTITRRLGATGRSSKPRDNKPSSSAVQNAKAFVTGILYRDTSIYDVISNLTIFDRVTTIDVSDTDGRYSINDTFIAYSGLITKPYTEKFSITNSSDEKLNRTVTIEGSIQGLKTLKANKNDLYWNLQDTDDYLLPTYQEDNNTAYLSASGALDGIISQELPYYRCLSTAFPSGFLNEYNSLLNPWSGWLNPMPVNSRVQHNIAQSTIDYTFTFNSRPIALVSGALTEDLGVEDNYATRDMATQSVFLRNPLLQDMGTYTIPSRTINYSARFPSVTGNIRLALNPNALSMINTAIEQFNPTRINPPSVPVAHSGFYYYYSWITENNESFNPIDGSFKKTKTWNYELRYIHPPA